ncbi:hypothetical protein [Shinella zoogloeoides]|uniref:hypothetical protein n=1 Tax=Shinella zoogloeoides TaxID=352475 RepID=UPI00273EDFAE|nr:hypothetical protein [Shinella zoogloeoides]WLR91302.1 hypothetical protein Q9316_12345 [Shinella zoogloeoides]
MNEDLRDAVNDAIAWHGGDVRATIGTLLADCAHLREQLDIASRAMGHGFTRGWRPASERE